MIYRAQLEAEKAQHQNEIGRFQVLKQEQLNIIDKLRAQITGLNEQNQKLQLLTGNLQANVTTLTQEKDTLRSISKTNQIVFIKNTFVWFKTLYLLLI